MEKIEKKPLGVIDALSGGFELVARRPWVLLIPVALDLFLWLGPQISARAIFQQVANLMTATSLQGAPPEALQNVEATKSGLQAMGEQFNVFSLLAFFAIGMPTFVVLSGPPEELLRRSVPLSIGDGAALLGWTVVFALAGLLLGTLYLESLARPVRRETGTGWSLVRRVAQSYLNILALMALGVIGVLVLMVPLVIGMVLVLFVNQSLGSFFIIVGSVLALCVELYLAFAIPAIFVSGSGVVQAIVNSITVFRYNFWSALSLVFLIYLLQFGFGEIWEGLQGTTWGVLVDVVASAFLGTALVAAGMLFYYDRFTWLTEVRERIRQHQRPLL